MAPWNSVAVAVQRALMTGAPELAPRLNDAKPENNNQGDFVDLGVFMEDHEELYNQMTSAPVDPVDPLDALGFQFHRAADLEPKLTREDELELAEKIAAEELDQRRRQLRRASSMLKIKVHQRDLDEFSNPEDEGETEGKREVNRSSTAIDMDGEKAEECDRCAFVERVVVPYRYVGFALFALLTIGSIVVLHVIATALQTAGACDANAFTSSYIVFVVVWDFTLCQCAFCGLCFTYHFLVGDSHDDENDENLFEAIARGEGGFSMLVKALKRVKLPAHPQHDQQLLYIPPKKKTRADEVTVPSTVDNGNNHIEPNVGDEGEGFRSHRELMDLTIEDV